MEIDSAQPVFVVGALNLDACGVPRAKFRPGDSNPGRVTLAAGGVGRNIAAHLAGAGARVELVAALGDDHAAWLLARLCERDRVGLSHAPTFPGASGCYLSLHDEGGDMVAAVNDMSLADRMTPEVLARLLPALSRAPLVALDANLPAETIEMLSMSVKAPLLLDPVSGFKAARARNVIGRFEAVKPNALEARALSGEEEIDRAAQWFLEKGTRRVFISLGAEGVYYADARERGALAAQQRAAVNVTGAGDALTAGVAFGLLKGQSTKECAITGLQFAAKHLVRQGGSHE